MMYLVQLKTLVVQALKATFGAAYPEEDFANTWVGIEYPISQQNYPGIWINYSDTSPTQIAGIDHQEIIIDSDGLEHLVTRWRFWGSVSFTVVAMSSLERDRLVDELVRVLAFGKMEDINLTAFRSIIENNSYLGLSINFDVLHPSGNSEAPGTPWGTDEEIIYEKTISIDVMGEYVSSPTINTLVDLSAVTVKANITGTTPPTFADTTLLPTDVNYGPGSWV
jgi:hypothetical protein